ncbi:MAG: DUF4112 domain-containing protein, partial [Cyanobacteria bacterium J06588_4]
IKMVKNVAIETAVGSVPIAGDIFDIYFKANMRNLEILENHLAQDEVEAEESSTKTLSEIAS